MEPLLTVEWVAVLQEQQLWYNKLLNMSCVISLSLYYRNICGADRSCQENRPSLHTHLSRHEDWEEAPKQHPPAQLRAFFLFSPNTHHEAEGSWFCGRNGNTTQETDSQLMATPGCEQGAAAWPWALDATAVLCTKSFDSNNLLSMHVHSISIPWFSDWEGSQPLHHLRSRLKRKWVGARGRDNIAKWHLDLSIKSAKTHSHGFLLYHLSVMCFQCLCPAHFCRFCSSLQYLCCLAKHHR